MRKFITTLILAISFIGGSVHAQQLTDLATVKNKHLKSHFAPHYVGASALEGFNVDHVEYFYKNNGDVKKIVFGYLQTLTTENLNTIVQNMLPSWKVKTRGQAVIASLNGVRFAFTPNEDKTGISVVQL